MTNTKLNGTVWDNDKGEYAKITRKADGSFYGDTGDYDFEAPTEEAMRAKLTKLGFTIFAGWEHD